MNKRTVSVDSIFKRFGGKFLNKTSSNNQRFIEVPSLTRLGMELNNVFLHKTILSIVVWGKTENKFLSSLTAEEKEKILKKILSHNPPLFLLSNFFEHDELILELNKKFNNNSSAIIKMDYSTREIFGLVGPWLTKFFANWSAIHGTVINIFGEGVLIIGEPGVGKSEIALELLRRNNLFLADDAVDITRFGNTLIAKASSISKHFIQVRGLGILNIKEMFGVAKIINETKITVIIELKQAENKEDLQQNFENLGEITKHKQILDIKIPLYVLPVVNGRNMSEIIELAIVNLKLKKNGYNAAKEFDAVTRKFIAEH